MRSVCRPLRSVVPNVDHHFHQHRFHAPADILQPIQSRADVSQLRCCVCCYWRRLLQAAAAALAEPSLAVGVCSCGSGVCKCGSCGCSKGQRWLPLRRRVRRRRRRQRRSCGTCRRLLAAAGCWLPLVTAAGPPKPGWAALWGCRREAMGRTSGSVDTGAARTPPPARRPARPR